MYSTCTCILLHFTSHIFHLASVDKRVVDPVKIGFSMLHQNDDLNIINTMLESKSSRRKYSSFSSYGNTLQCMIHTEHKFSKSNTALLRFKKKTLACQKEQAIQNPSQRMLLSEIHCFKNKNQTRAITFLLHTMKWHQISV